MLKLFGSAISMDEALRRTSYLRQPKEINPHDEYDLDKWYRGTTKVLKLDIKAAEALGVSIKGVPATSPKRLTDLPLLKDLLIPSEAVREMCTLDEGHWNWPKLITEYEILNKCRVSKASVELAQRNHKITVPTSIMLESAIPEGKTVREWYNGFIDYVWPEKMMNSDDWSLDHPVYLKYSDIKYRDLLKIVPYLGQITRDSKGEMRDGEMLYGNHFSPTKEVEFITEGAINIFAMVTTYGQSELAEEDTVFTSKMRKALKNLQPRHYTIYKGEKRKNYLLIAVELGKMFGVFPSKKSLLSELGSQSK